MADLNKLTPDEQALLIHIVSRNICLDLISQATKIPVQEVKAKVAKICGRSIAEMDDFQAKMIINHVRRKNRLGKERFERDYF